jgi:hypothetical protein
VKRAAYDAGENVSETPFEPDEPEPEEDFGYYEPYDGPVHEPEAPPRRKRTKISFKRAQDIFNAFFEGRVSGACAAKSELMLSWAWAHNVVSARAGPLGRIL